MHPQFCGSFGPEGGSLKDVTWVGGLLKAEVGFAGAQST